jgi:hypothetical protein
MNWVLVFVVLVGGLGSAAAQTSRVQPPSHPNAPADQDLQTEKVYAPGQIPASTTASAAPTGYLDPTQLRALTHKIWLAQFHLTDLLSQVQPATWRTGDSTRMSFNQSLDSLRKAISSEESWRNQFDSRPDSLYLGFETYMAIGAVLPRVDGVAKGVAHYENASFGGQFTQAANQLFDLQQVLAPHLEYLLKNQDNGMLVIQNNLASCQRELSYAEHGKEGHATPMKNIVPEFKGRKKPAHPPATH